MPKKSKWSVAKHFKPPTPPTSPTSSPVSATAVAPAASAAAAAIAAMNTSVGRSIFQLPSSPFFLQDHITSYSRENISLNALLIENRGIS